MTPSQRKILFSSLITFICMGVLTARKTDIPTIIGMSFMTAAVGIMVYFFTDRKEIAKGIWIAIGFFAVVFLIIEQMGWLSREV